MSHTLLLKFIAFFAILSVFLTTYTAWSGSGEEVAGWTTFTTTLNGGPGAWMPFPPPTAPSSGLADLSSYTSLYPQNQLIAHVGCAGYRFGAVDPRVGPPWSLMNYAPRQTATYPSVAHGLTADGFVNYSFPANAARGGSTANDFIQRIDPGEWNVTSYLTDMVAASTQQIKVIVEIAEITPRLGGGACTFSHNDLVFAYVLNVTLPKYPAYATVYSTVKTDRGRDNFDLVSTDRWGFILLQYFLPYDETYAAFGNTRVHLITTEAHPIKLALPPSRDASQDCTDIFCSIGHFFGSIALWMAFVVEGIVWVVVAAGVTVAWFFATIALFFAALFSLSLAGVFGPFGVLVGIFLTLFLALLIMTLADFVRGTSGSVGI